MWDAGAEAKDVIVFSNEFLVTKQNKRKQVLVYCKQRSVIERSKNIFAEMKL